MNNEMNIKAQLGYFKFKDLSKVLTSYRELKSGVIIQNLRYCGDFFFPFIIQDDGKITSIITDKNEKLYCIYCLSSEHFLCTHLYLGIYWFLSPSSSSHLIFF